MHGEETRSLPLRLSEVEGRHPSAIDRWIEQPRNLGGTGMRTLVLFLLAATCMFAGLALVRADPSVSALGGSGAAHIRVGADCTPAFGFPSGAPRCARKASPCVGRSSGGCLLSSWNTACAAESSFLSGGPGLLYVKSMTCSGTYLSGLCEWDAHEQLCRWHVTTGIYWCGTKDVSAASNTDCRSIQPGALPPFDPINPPPGI